MNKQSNLSACQSSGIRFVFATALLKTCLKQITAIDAMRLVESGINNWNLPITSAKVFGFEGGGRW